MALLFWTNNLRAKVSSRTYGAVMSHKKLTSSGHSVFFVKQNLGSPIAGAELVWLFP
jgi:hypothetical protein